jgi:hypothetical protein
MCTAPLMIAAAVLALVAVGPCQAQSGLLTPRAAPYWPQWQGRLVLGPNTVGHSLDDTTLRRSSSVLGDYYFHRHTISLSTSSLGGFRATSGILSGNAAPRLLFGQRAEPTSAGGMELGGLSLVTPSAGRLTDSDDRPSSYLGLGYTLLSLQGGWGVSADIGLTTSVRSSNLLGRGLGLGTGGTEYSLRDLRSTPLLHLGLTYSF